MKQLNKLHLIAPAALAFTLGLAGCATNQTKDQALVCPDCKMVEITVAQRTLEYDSYFDTTTTNKMVHRCPNCQGALKTFFTEGKLQHTCTVCTQNGFTCPVDHRW